MSSGALEFGLVDGKSGLVVGIGASAGGLQALEDFFRDMPPTPGMAFVVVQHLSPNYRSLMAELMARCTVLEVIRVEDGMELRENVVHLIPPKTLMHIEGRTLRLEAQVEPRVVNLPIDLFFRSLAAEHGERAVGIVLSGTGSDGTLGVRAIKGAGGLVMVQEPTSAKFDGMPRSALQTRLVDVSLPPDGLRDKLLSFAEYPVLQEKEDAHLSSMQKVLEVLRVDTDVDFSLYRVSTLSRRVERRMQLNQIADLETYLHVLRQDPAEVTALFKDALIGVTRFFRDPEAFEELRARLRVEIEQHPPGQDFRVWSVACSTGEEPYSLAILINQLSEELGIRLRLKLFATDIDRVALRVAGLGVYPESIASDVPKEILERYFRRSPGTYTITEELRKQVIFSYHNVLADPPFNRLNLVSLRNMMIYLEVEAQQLVLASMSFALHLEGLLFLGPSETVGELASDFATLNNRWNIYKRRPIARSRMPSPRAIGRSLGHPNPAPAVLSSRPSLAPTRSVHAEREVFRQIMARHAPATLVVDDAHRVAMAFGPVHRYVRVPVGTMSLDLQSMAEGGLGVVISGGIHRARDMGQSVRYQRVEASDPGDGAPHFVDITVDPLPTVTGALGLFAVVIQAHASGGAETVGLAPIDLPQSQHLHDLQEELQYTRESHQATIEELETSNEELQAMNEELLSSNEELQSTNEELQSVNEELVTVNAEFQSKIDELQQLNADMDNVFLSSGTGTLFLDNQLRIRKFSPAVAEHFNLVAKDLYRPLNHFSFGLDYPDFFDDARNALETLSPCAREVSKGNTWYLVKIAPYFAEGQPVSGVVVTFVDVSERRQKEDELVRLRAVTARIGADLTPRRVLAVDDDEDHLALIVAELESSELVSDVIVARPGAEALAALQGDEKVDLVFLDLGLPDMTGFQVLEAIRGDDALATLPVVIVSSDSSPEHIRQAYRLHANCYVTKPNLSKQLSSVIRQVHEYWFSVVERPTGRRRELD